jgi:hypothetical protein
VSHKQTIEELLCKYRFELVAERKHLKYKNPEGKIFIAAKTPSDWRAEMNSLTTLKRVIASPVPTSEVIEEERQRRGLESTIKLQPNVKLSRGLGGSGKKKRSRGTGFIYEDPAKEEPTPEQLEQRENARQRSNRREEQRRVGRLERKESNEWKLRLYEFRRAVRDSKSDLTEAWKFGRRFVAFETAKNHLAQAIKLSRKASRAYRRDKARNVAVVTDLAKDIFDSLWIPDVGERLYISCLADEESSLDPPPLDEERDARLLAGSRIPGEKLFPILVSEDFRRGLLNDAGAYAAAIWFASGRAPAWAFQFPDVCKALRLDARQRRNLKQAALDTERSMAEPGGRSDWLWIVQAIRKLMAEAEDETKKAAKAAKA